MQIKYFISKLPVNLYKLIKYGKIQSTVYIVDDDKKLVFIANQKCASKSIRATFATEEEIKSDRPLDEAVNIRLRTISLSRKQKKYFKFSFVRNPFDRLVSCHIHRNRKNYFMKNCLLGRNGEIEKDFKIFVKNIVNIPNSLMNRHIQSQYSILYRRGKPRFDYLGYFEKLEEDFETIKNKYGLRELGHLNNMKKGDWRDYYDLETVRLVYEKYKKDFGYFGYEDEYLKLIEYIKNITRHG